MPEYIGEQIGLLFLMGFGVAGFIYGVHLLYKLTYKLSGKPSEYDKEEEDEADNTQD
jgi:hypothetical protein